MKHNIFYSTGKRKLQFYLINFNSLNEILPNSKVLDKVFLFYTESFIFRKIQICSSYDKQNLEHLPDES